MLERPALPVIALWVISLLAASALVAVAVLVEVFSLHEVVASSAHMSISIADQSKYIEMGSALVIALLLISAASALRYALTGWDSKP